MSGSIELIDVPQHPLPVLEVPPVGGRGLRAICIPCDDVEATFREIDNSEWAANVCQPLRNRQLPGGWVAKFVSDGPRRRAAGSLSTLMG